jgi:hypothetical protein
LLGGKEREGDVKKTTDTRERNREEPRQGSHWKNIGRIVFLIVVLVAAWFILDKLISYL